jgi:hypothetical protein
VLLCGTKQHILLLCCETAAYKLHQNVQECRGFQGLLNPLECLVSVDIPIKRFLTSDRVVRDINERKS